MQDIQITLTGNVGTDIDLAHGEGWARASFRLAVTPRQLRQGQWVDAETTWVQANCWGRLASNVKASLSKGDPVLVQGRLRTQAWLKDGIRNERLVVEVATIGHDLSRGTAQFVRSGAKMRTTEGDVIDPTTGQVYAEAQLSAAVSDAVEPPTDEDVARAELDAAERGELVTPVK